MNGREVFKHSVKKFVEMCETVLSDSGYGFEDLSCLITHQANERIIQSVINNTNIKSDKVVMTMKHHANTCSASIPLAFSEVASQQKVKEGDLVLLEGFGAGFTWGSVLLRY